MDIFEVFKARGSCRSYSQKPIDREAVEQIIEAGCQAPSALNQQPWKFVVVEKRETIDEIAELSISTRDKLAEATGQKWVAKYDPSFVRTAKALIIVAADPTKIGLGAFLDEKDAHMRAASACIENMLLAATAKGLGSMWFTMYDKKALSGIISLPDGLEIAGLLPVGYPEGEIKSPPKKSSVELTTYIA